LLTMPEKKEEEKLVKELEKSRSQSRRNKTVP
jgi:hypothetical protein